MLTSLSLTYNFKYSDKWSIFTTLQPYCVTALPQTLNLIPLYSVTSTTYHYAGITCHPSGAACRAAVPPRQSCPGNCALHAAVGVWGTVIGILLMEKWGGSETGDSDIQCSMTLLMGISKKRPVAPASSSLDNWSCPTSLSLKWDW